MTTRPDAHTCLHLEEEHVRFDTRVRQLLLQPGTDADWTASMKSLASDIFRHLDAESTTVLGALEREGPEGLRMAARLRADEARIRDDLRELRSHPSADRANLLLLSYDLTAHGVRSNAVLQDWEAVSSVPERHLIASEAACVVTGMLVGATIGSVGGPIGLVGGAVAGGLAAGVAMVAAHNANEDRRERDEYLDREIGVFGGHIGEASPNAPPARIGAFSAAASGSGGRGANAEPDAAGPISGPVSQR